MSADILTVDGFTKIYRVPRLTGFGRQDAPAAQNISFRIPAGGALAVIGESGSGKSTIARSIVGLEHATSGRILVDGEDWTRRPRRNRERRRRGGIVQMVFQDPYDSLDPRQTVAGCIGESLRLHTSLDGPGRAARTAELLEQVRFPASLGTSLPRALSGGQRQRVAIARALAAEPGLLVLDEAVSALDVSVQAQVLKLLADIRERTGVAILFISHDLGVVNQICDDVIVMRRGSIVESGRIGEVLGAPTHDYTRRLIDSIPRPGWRPRRGRLAAVDADGRHATLDAKEQQVGLE